MRKFYLVNDKGTKYALDLSNNILVSSPDGLGVSKDIEYATYRDQYSKLEEKNLKSEIELILIFLDNYRGYKRFLSYIEASDTFQLYYFFNEWRYCNAEIVSLSKTEISGGALSSTLTLEKLSYWYKDITKEMEIERDESKGKVYDYSYPYTYSDSIKGYVEITNSGYFKSPLRIVINGAFKNPEINVYRNGEVLSSFKIYYASEDATLLVDADPLGQTIEITEDGKTVDAYQYQDFSKDNFISLERGTYTIEFKPFVDDPPTCTISLREGYLGN